MLREAIGVLLEYAGHDRVNLDIQTSAGRVLMELPVVSTNYCEELGRRLSALLGAESVRLYDFNGPEPGGSPQIMPGTQS